MNRKQLQSTLESLIPSLSYEGFKKDKLFRDGSKFNHPYIIPQRYAEGMTLEYDGRIYTSEYRDHFSDKNYGRQVNLELQSFYGGGGHWYGDLRIRMPDFICGNRSVGGSIIDGFPQVRDIHLDICRILPQTDRDNFPHHWLDWEVGEPTTRFYSMKELIYSAMYIALDRIQGPFYFTIGSSCELKAPEFVVTKNGTIKFSKESKIKKMLK